MSKSMTIERVTEFAAAWNSRNPDLIASFFTEDGVYHASVGPDHLGRTFVGRAEIRKSAKALFNSPTGRSRI